MIVDPQTSGQRIVLRTVHEPTKAGASANQHAAGQIELLDPSQRPQTIIQQGIIHSPVLRSHAIVVVDPTGRPRVVGGVKLEAAADANKAPPTSGFVEIFGKDNSATPAVRLANSADGGYVTTQREGLPLRVAVGNFASGSGVYLQIGDRLLPLSGAVSENDIKKLEALSAKTSGRNQPDKDGQGSGSDPRTTPTVQPTEAGTANEQ